MKKNYLICSLITLLISPPGLSAQEYTSGDADIDRIRREVKRQKTIEENFRERHLMLYMWLGALQQQGADTHSLFDLDTDVPATLRRIDHHGMDWVRACKESPGSRVESASYFGESGPFNEMVVMGVLAVRLQGLHRVLEWDGPNMRFTNIGDDDTIRMVREDNLVYRENDRPRSQKTWTEWFNAGEFAARLVRPEYREGWSLPSMP